uniref:uncharacterized protein n=1 Tax=Centroberyx gerrardi TaxID=166262 RepID=UPI003AAF91B7
MTNYKAFHSQLTSIMEALTKAAVAEICELVDDSYAVLQLEISRSHKENDALRRKLELIETIIARGHRGNIAMLDYNGQEAGGLVDFTVERALSTGFGAKQPKASLKKSGRVLAVEAATEMMSPVPTEVNLPLTVEEPNDPDVVLIKEETAGEEASGDGAADELLLNEDGTEVQQIADDCEEGPSGMIIAATAASMRQWEQNSDGASEQLEPRESHSESGSPGPAGGADNDSSEVVFDLASESDSEAPSVTLTRKPFLLGSGGSPTSLPGTFDLKRGVSMISSLPYDMELEMCSSWNNQGLPSMVPVPRRPYLKPDHRAPHLDKVSDLNAAGFPLALGLGVSKMDPLDLNRYCRDRRFICSYCGKCFTSSRSLETHVRVHTGERPYSCAQCGKRFTQSGHLKTHQSVHTGERPFACEHCGKRFAGKQNLRIHQQKHHPADQGAAPVHIGDQVEFESSSVRQRSGAAVNMNGKALHEQLSIIMGALTKAAVAEICEVVDEGYAVLQMEITRSHKENEDLKKKLHLIESIIVRGNSGKAAAEAPVPGVEDTQADGSRQQDGEGGGGATAGGDEEATVTVRELPDVVLIKDEDSDSNDTFDEGTRTSADAASSQIRSMKRHWPGSEEGVCQAERKKSSEQNTLRSPARLSGRSQKKPVPQYTLDSPGSEPGCSGQLDDEKEAGESVGSYSSQIDPDVHLVHQECPLVPAMSSANRQAAYFGSHGGSDALMESQSPTNKGELDLSLTWTKQSKSHMAFAQFHQNESIDSDAFGLKLISVSGSTSTDCQLSESSNSGFEFEDADMMNFGLYRDPSGRPQHCNGQMSDGAKGKRFICSICSKTYATSQNLDVHMRIHTGERPFSCGQCGKKFTQSAHLKSHLSVHSGERPYSCALCSKSFIVKYSLKLHMRKCHSTLASIMEVLANTAMAEICELVDSGYSVLQLEISRSRKENEVLRRKLRLMELKAARATALRAAGTTSSFLASSRARVQQQQQQQQPAQPGEVVLPRVSAQVPPPCGDTGPPGDTGQDTTHRQQPAAAEPATLKTPLVKVEKDEEAWTHTEQDKGFSHAVDGQPGESRTETEAPPPATKQEVSEPDGSGSCSWAGGEVNATVALISANLTANKRPENTAGQPEPLGFDCMMYEPPLQHGSCTTQNPLSEDPGCSYSLNTSVSVSAPSDTGSGFSFAVSEATRPSAEQQQPAVFPDSRQRAPLPADEPQISVRKEIAPVPNAFIMREGWRSQDGLNGGGGNYNRDDGAKSFVCSCCGKTLACLKNLKTHMRVHTGEKPFGCALCGKRFSDSSNLKRHQSVHTGEKRYSCVHCGKRFAQSGSLKVHMTVHTGVKQFRCLHCGKTFISANHLRRHISVHDGEKRLPPAFQ